MQAILAESRQCGVTEVVTLGSGNCLGIRKCNLGRKRQLAMGVAERAMTGIHSSVTNPETVQTDFDRPIEMQEVVTVRFLGSVHRTAPPAAAYRSCHGFGQRQHADEAAPDDSPQADSDCIGLGSAQDACLTRLSPLVSRFAVGIDSGYTRGYVIAD